jgi:hypothetical protein
MVNRATSPIWRLPIRTAKASGRSREPLQLGQGSGWPPSDQITDFIPEPAQAGQAPNLWLQVNSLGSETGSPCPQRGQALRVE